VCVCVCVCVCVLSRHLGSKTLLAETSVLMQKHDLVA